jgi:hypothetical protein
MPGTRDLRLIATVHCKPYQCEARIYIQDKHPSGYRHLVAQYGDGYAGRTDLPIADNGCREFAAAMPHDMGEQEIIDRWLLWPMNPRAPYPTWEVPARVHGSWMLFRWWAGEKAV